jgi:hypothetical protein
MIQIWKVIRYNQNMNFRKFYNAALFSLEIPKATVLTIFNNCIFVDFYVLPTTTRRE